MLIKQLLLKSVYVCQPTYLRDNPKNSLTNTVFTMNATEIITALELAKHPEGGYYKRIYCSEERSVNRQGNERAACTAIHYLLQAGQFSRLHRIQSDELWFHQQGVALEIVTITQGELQRVVLGSNLLAGERLSHRVPAQQWFGARVLASEGFALVSCVVSPGFDFEDFELAKREELISEFPHLREMIEQFT